MLSPGTARWGCDVFGRRDLNSIDTRECCSIELRWLRPSSAAIAETGRQSSNDLPASFSRFNARKALVRFSRESLSPFSRETARALNFLGQHTGNEIGSIWRARRDSNS
jgi:hypothetical protein